MGLRELIEEIVLHSIDGKVSFEADSLVIIEQMRGAYGLDLTAADSHKLAEE